MSKWLRIALKALLGLCIVLALIWFGAAFYIKQNNQKILSQILTQVNQKVSGQVTIGSMSPNLLKGFPNVSVSLNEVLIRDSLWKNHHHDLVNAKKIEVSLNIFSLLAGTVNIRKAGLNNADICIYTDSTGYSNTSAFKSKEAKTENQKTEKNNDNLKIGRIDFKDVNLIIDNRKRFKLFNFKIDALNGKIKYGLNGWDGNIKLKTYINSFAFNTHKGSFLKDKQIEGTISAHFNDNTKQITLDQNKLKIGNDIFYIGAQIQTAKGKSGFKIDIKTDNILYKNVSLLLAPNISSKLLKFGIEKPVNIIGSIVDDGSNSPDPLVHVKMTVKDNKVTIPSGELNACNFIGTFTNKDTLNREIGDENSIIRFYNLKADYYNAPISVDTFTVTNFSRPVAVGLIKSAFPLTNLNSSLGGETFLFKNGTANIKLFCKADIDHFLFTKPVIWGDVNINNADITYLPRQMRLINSNLVLKFNQKDLDIKSSRIQLGKSVVAIDCNISNFLNFYYTDPNKIQATLKMTSPQLYISEFIPFLGPRKGTIKKKTTKENTIKQVSDQLDAVLEAAKINIQLKVNRAIYNKFTANNLTADIALLGNGVYFNKINVSHAGGHLSLNGKLMQSGAINRYQFNSNINNVNVKEFFYAFDNFGQNSVTSKNLKGFLSANVNASGNITDKGAIVSRSMFGTVKFTLNKAALVGFEPLEKIGKFIFRSRNLANVELEKLNGLLTLNGDKVNISPMQVNSTALNFNVKGIYGFTNGTNIALDIPLRDPKKSAGIVNEEERQLARMKGIVLHLKAVDEEGKLKIKWNKDHD